MLRTSNRLGRLFFACVSLCAMLCVTAVHANNDGGNNNNNNNNNNDNGNNSGFQAAGVEIDAAGVLRVMQPNFAESVRLLRDAKSSLPQELARPSKLRKVSLNRLEQAVSEKLAQGEKLDPEMLTLAGMTRLECVFFYPESGDIVVAGPAEGFGRDSLGRVVGVDSGRPCILLQDLIVALRAYPPQGDATNVIGVSIDPTQEGLARMQETLQQLGTQFRGPADVPGIVRALKNSLGLNTVTITGIPAGTNFAHILTEADYRMKLIGIGLENPPVPLKSYVARLTSSMTSSNALVRWFFVPDYSAIATTEDGQSMRLIGQGVKLVGEDELVSRDGSRKVSGRRANPASAGFTSEFTEKFRTISERSEIYSQLRNLVDLAMAAAFIQDRDLYGQAGWDLGTFGREDQLPVEILPAPQQVETAINAVMKGSRLITPIGGGVTIQARKALADENIQTESNGEITKQRDQVGLDIPADQWWWD